MYLEIALKYKVKQSKNGKFPSNYKASPIDFETQKGPLKNISLGAYFRNFTVSHRTSMVAGSFRNWITMIKQFYFQLKKELSDAILAAEHERNTFKAEVCKRFAILF